MNPNDFGVKILNKVYTDNHSKKVYHRTTFAMAAMNKIFMFGFLFKVILVQTALSTENHTENCASWPSGLKTLSECCEIPVHNNKEVENTCENYCAFKKDFGGEHMDCVLNCYVNRTRILTRKEKINAISVVSLYEKNDFTGHWTEVINRGIASCNYESIGALKENLVKYFNCIDDYLAENCIWFKDDDGCYDVFNHFKNCSSPQIDCSIKTARYASDCCIKPQVLTSTSISCNLKCTKEEFLSSEQHMCALMCHSVETGLLTSDGNINFEKAIENLQKSREFSDKWIQPVGNAVEFCKAEVNSE